MKNIVKISPIQTQRAAPLTQWLLSLIVVATLATTSYIRNDVWLSELLLMEDVVMKSPDKGRVHHNLGREYDKHRLSREAFEQYRIAVSVEPDLAMAHESLGISYVNQGRLNIARHELETALRQDPDLFEARMFLDYIAKQEQQDPRRENVRLKLN